jgi:hypothetical protein
VPDSGGSYGDKTYGLVIVPRGADAETVSRTLLAPASNAIALGEDSSLRNWMGATVVPGGVSRDLYRSVYSELVTAPWHATRACFLGDMAGCRRALGLAGGTDPLADWYSPGDYHQLVLEQQVRGTAVPDQLNRCLHVPDDAACLAVLRSGWYRPNYRQSAWRPPSPLSPRARVTFVTVALETGGAGAYERLVADAAAPLPQRLAAAAGEPFDSLVTRWRARVIAAPAPPVAVPERSAWMVVGWALIFGFLALRSTRWR